MGFASQRCGGESWPRPRWMWLQMWLARAQGVTGFERASELDPTGARRERSQENETRRCGETKPNPPRPARHHHLPVQVPESRNRAPRRHPCSPPPPGHCSAKRVPDPCLRPTSVVTARRIDPGVRRGLHLGSSRVGSSQYLAQESPVRRLLPWGSRASAFIVAGAGLHGSWRESRAPGAGPSAGARTGSCRCGGRRHGGVPATLDPAPVRPSCSPRSPSAAGAGASNQRPGRGRRIRRGFQKQNLAHRRAEERVMGAWEGLRPRSLDSYR